MWYFAIVWARCPWSGSCQEEPRPWLAYSPTLLTAMSSYRETVAIAYTLAGNAS